MKTVTLYNATRSVVKIVQATTWMGPWDERPRETADWTWTYPYGPADGAYQIRVSHADWAIEDGHPYLQGGPMNCPELSHD